MRRWPFLLMLFPLVFTSSAGAAVGEGPAAFEEFLFRVPRSTWRKLPDAESGGLLYAGRVSSLDTIVHVFLKDGVIQSERIEVAIATDRNDELALAVLTRFLSEFVHRPRELLGVMNTMRALRRSILATGHRTVKLPYRKAVFNLALSASPSEFNSKNMDIPWGMLYWTAEATPTAAPKKETPCPE